jgi:uncharacterized protein YbjT (DUF2867 family)
MAMRVLVAGAGGALGRLVLHELEGRGHAVRAVVRRATPAAAMQSGARDVRVLDALRDGAWRGVCDGVDVVVSTLGASVNPSPLVGRKPYTRVDAPANIALLDEARRSGVRRFVYVSLVGGAASRSLNYSEGHERVVDALRASGVPGTVLRPTGFFCAMAALIEFARRGFVPVIGDGACRTNPIDERDVASAAAAAAESAEPGFAEVELGGPEVFTRRRIAELAFESLGKRPRLLPVPRWFAKCGGASLLPLNPRAAHFTLFAAHIMTHDCLAPHVGSRCLRDYFRAHVAARAKARGDRSTG